MYQSQKIGVMGATGDAAGPHLHFEVRENGVAVNPYILGYQRKNGDTMTHSQDVAYLQAHNPNPQVAITLPTQGSPSTQAAQAQVASANLNLQGINTGGGTYIPPTPAQNAMTRA